ncbi:unnamed protein product [Prorocentrum cordatum]|uniref:Uncharacterized protein n=1 Tax=Prorocentrum cordatum TaxID=2364126 RepID=A0ABN9Q297_9DINO|nr:unnamed protein product [Polarella glacialis]
MAMSCEADTVVDMIYKPEINVELPDTRMNAKGMEAVGPKTSPETGARHPLEKLLVDNAKRAEQQEMMAKSVVFGQHAPIRAKMERELMAQFQRLPGLPSSMMGLETVLGLDTTIEWEGCPNGFAIWPSENAHASGGEGVDENRHAGPLLLARLFEHPPEDVFNREEDAPMPRTVGPNFPVHRVMEKRLNMRF